jgi:hypothetical protein
MRLLAIILLLALACGGCSFRLTLVAPFARNNDAAVGPDLSREVPPK